MSEGGVWTDRDGAPATAPEPPAAGAVYQAIGDFQGPAYERNAFALGTAQEAAFLWEALRLQPGEIVVDVGCGTGRHTAAFARRGAEAVGLDVSAGLLAVGAAAGGAYVQGDARRLPLRTASADAVLCVCQGGFGITPDSDRIVLAELARILRPGGRLALTAFSLPFAARWMSPEDRLDVRRGLLWSSAEVRGPEGERRIYDLWTSCYAPAHLADLVTRYPFELESISGIQPGQYGRSAPTIADPELLVLATRKVEPR